MASVTDTGGVEMVSLALGWGGGLQEAVQGVKGLPSVSLLLVLSTSADHTAQQHKFHHTCRVKELRWFPFLQSVLCFLQSHVWGVRGMGIPSSEAVEVAEDI